MGKFLSSLLEIVGVIATFAVMALNAMGIAVNPWLASFLWGLAAAALLEFLWRKLAGEGWFLVSKLLVSVVVLIVAGWLVWLSFERARSPLDTESMPGFSASFGVTFNVATVNRPQYLFESKTSEGASVAFYLAQNSSHFVLRVRDVNGEEHSLDAPIGADSVPLGKVLFLTCQVGVSDTATFLQVIIDGEDVAHETISFPLLLGSKDWPNHTTIFADSEHKNFSAFSLQYLSAGHVTMTSSEYKSQMKIEHDFINAIQQAK